MWVSHQRLLETITTAVRTVLCTDKDKNEVLTLEEKVSRLNGQIDTLKVDKRKLKEEVEDIKTKRRLDETELKVLVQAQKDRLEIESERNTVALEGKFVEKEKVLLKDFHSKAEALLQQNKSDIQDMLGQVMKCLPNVNWNIGAKDDGSPKSD